MTVHWKWLIENAFDVALGRPRRPRSADLRSAHVTERWNRLMRAMLGVLRGRRRGPHSTAVGGAHLTERWNRRVMLGSVGEYRTRLAVAPW
ncbi:hypothetical protein ACFYV7_19220 [Nocardia suismassiliense]|uniref:Transposase n=1 Tax=Nocardia suismassiliense TaxID=2077092 RepID=A0ABW6QUM5_9NOCA|nr:hypothetical protein [Nocardia sp. XZ_19_369]